jgi:hypothetical protein
MFRVPYALSGTITVTSSQVGVQFADAVFINNVDKPFEVHRMIPRVTGFDTATPAVMLASPPTDEEMEKILRLKISDLSLNQAMMKSSTYLEALTKGTAEKTWEWAEPYTIDRAEGFQVVVDADAFPVYNPVLGAIRLELTFQGFLIVVAPPGENR